MKELLPLLPRPSRYLGNEWGVKVKSEALIRVALAFPDLYDVGMSYLGHKILYEVINQKEGFAAERVYAPCQDTANLLREHKAALATLETDTSLGAVDAIAFSLTHELCFSNVLYMLDLAGIPLLHADRDNSHPLIMAGGGACFNAEPIADFMDLMVVGDGELILPDILEQLALAKEKNISKQELLEQLRYLPGVYIPSFFETQEQGHTLRPVFDDYTFVEKAVVSDLADVPFPTLQPVSFGQAVHDRLTLEIARGCTRGCRFCQAGMIYRPVRERSVQHIEQLLHEGLAATGFEETSFLSLSTGDYSALTGLFTSTFDHCAEQQISISLPSLRVGSISQPIMERISSIRRTGATLAPEAGTQRMRDVINKGINEEELLEHVHALFEHGWQSIKLYFMIGLPTETDEDLKGILDLCLKVRAIGKGTKRLQVTAAVSPFVPKPHTPFQWEEQLPFDELQRRLDLLYELFRPHKNIRLKSHLPRMSLLEGVFSRGDRRLGAVLQSAYEKGAVFSSWKDHLDLAPYAEALAENGLSFEEFLKARDIDADLPWKHIRSGVSSSFLLAERKRALTGRVTEDCRYKTCRNCGVCNHENRESELVLQNQKKKIYPRIIRNVRDQELAEAQNTIALQKKENLGAKGAHFRLWFEKIASAAYLSQLELQSVFERAFRRAKLPISFSEGFHPMPRISFGKALPVGVESTCEWLNIMLRVKISHAELIHRLKGMFPAGIQLVRAEELSLSRKQKQPAYEAYTLKLFGSAAEQENMLANWKRFLESTRYPVTKISNKGTKSIDIRPLVQRGILEPALAHDDSGACTSIQLSMDWSQKYMSPLFIVTEVSQATSLTQIRLIKNAQSFEPIDI